MAHILVVCTANLCRSPVAMAWLRDRLNKNGYDGWTVSSAGTWAMSTRGASHNSVVVMSGYGLDISDHVSRMIDRSILQEADLVLCMEEGHVEALKAEFPDQAGKIYPISAMDGISYSISDPYGGELLEYQKMAMELEGIIDRGFDRIIALAEANYAARQ